MERNLTLFLLEDHKIDIFFITPRFNEENVYIYPLKKGWASSQPLPESDVNSSWDFPSMVVMETMTQTEHSCIWSQNARPESHIVGLTCALCLKKR